MSESSHLLSTSNVGDARKGHSLFLNLCSTFLTAFSLYAPVTTAGVYCESLGRSKDDAGLFFSFSFLFAIIGNTFFSSYMKGGNVRRSIILASSVSLVGNLIYALAATFHSFALILFGRLFIGVGVARAVNRFYIYEYSEESDLTNNYADFVSFSALGFAAGSILQLFIKHVLLTEKDGFSAGIFGLYFDERTNISWILVFVWTFFILYFRNNFHEPFQEKSDQVVEEKPIADLPKKESHDWVVYLLAIWTIKATIDTFIVSTPNYLSHYFSWKKDSIDFYVLVITILVLVGNLFVRLLKSLKVSDTIHCIIWLTALCIAAFAIWAYNGIEEKKIRAAPYLFAGGAMFVFANAGESVASTPFKKNYPSSWNKTIFNAGLVNTIVGNIGKAMGDFYITRFDVKTVKSTLYISLIFIPICIILLFIISRILSDELEKYKKVKDPRDIPEPFWDLPLVPFDSSIFANLQDSHEIIDIKQVKINSELLSFSSKGELDKVRAILTLGADINCRDKYGSTAIIHAAKNGHSDTIRYLLENGSEIDSKDNSRKTALIWASMNDQFDSVKLLKEARADLNAKGMYGETALMWAAFFGNTRIVLLLVLEGRAEVNTLSKKNETALMAASLRGNNQIVETLLRLGAEPNDETDDGWTALMFASLNNHFETVKLLVKNGSYVNRKSLDGRTALEIAHDNNNVQIVQFLEETEMQIPFYSIFNHASSVETP